MFAGKTEELLRRVRRAVIAGRAVRVITHALDTRGGSDRVASHAGLGHASQAVPSASDIANALDDGTEMAAIDEAHFFCPGLVAEVGGLAARGLVVVVTGLDVTFGG